jgi:[ribosomal protein S18]-alanine N-acetyltransferase
MMIREMTPQDCEALGALRDEVWLGIDPEVELAGRLTRAWVVCGAAGDALGYALGWWVVDELQLLAIGVLPRARGCGLGRALLEHLASHTHAAGGRRVILEVASSNTAARRLYESAGFRVFNVRRGYYRGGEDALEMERSTLGATGARAPD